jgi:hypothetical protein
MTKVALKKDKTEDNNKPGMLQEYSEEEKVLIAKFQERRREMPPRAKMTREGGKVKVECENVEKLALWDIKLAEATGTVSDTLINSFLTQATNTFWGYQESPSSDCINATIALLHGIRPQDETEGMLAVQMVGVHNLAMEFLRRAMLKDQPPEGVNDQINRATKLLRTFTTQMETLNRYRNKGQQKVTVEHVHVNAGGQAIVGVVEGKPGGGQ